MAIKNYKNLLEKVEKVVKQKDLDLSSGEDLSIGIMNLISIEEHLFFSSQKTGNKKYLELLNEVRKMRTELMKDIVKDIGGEFWCISKHLLAASMRVMEVGTKELKKGNNEEAWGFFRKSYDLYALFWGLNLGAVKIKDVKQEKKEDEAPRSHDRGIFSLLLRRERNPSEAEISSHSSTRQGERFSAKGDKTVFDKLGTMINKVLDCCRE